MSDETVAVDSYPMCAICVGFQLTPRNILDHARSHGYDVNGADDE